MSVKFNHTGTRLFRPGEHVIGVFCILACSSSAVKSCARPLSTLRFSKSDTWPVRTCTAESVADEAASCGGIETATASRIQTGVRLRHHPRWRMVIAFTQEHVCAF